MAMGSASVSAAQYHSRTEFVCTPLRHSIMPALTLRTLRLSQVGGLLDCSMQLQNIIIKVWRIKFQLAVAPGSILR